MKLILGCTLLSGFIFAAIPEAPAKTFLDKLPLRFEPSATGAGYEARGAHFDLHLQASENLLEWTARGTTVNVRTRLEGGKRSAAFAAEDRLAGSANYFVGDQAAWRTDVPGFSRVRSKGIYPGIDLVFHGEQGRLEYDFVIAPHADPRAIRLELSGQQSLRISADGDLIVSTGAGDIRWKRPEIYQEIADVRQAVAGRFVIDGKRVVRFDIENYDRNRALVVDPTLSYATYLGGPGLDSARGLGMDSAGNVYIAGVTNTSDLDTVSAYQPNFGGQAVGNFVTGDGFVAKFSPTGTLLYLTYIGGSQNDGVTAIAVDAAGDAYLAGATTSTNFPIVGGYQTQYAGDIPTGNYIRMGDAFVAKLNPSGNKLIYSTYLGGSGDDVAFAVAIDAAGDAYVAGATSSLNFPLTPGGGAYQGRMTGGNGEPVKPCCALPFWDPGNAFVAKLDPTGSRLLFSTYLGGSLDDTALAIAVDSSSNVYVAGCSISFDFPTTTGAFQNHFGGLDSENTANFGDGFVTKLNSTGSSLIYSTYIGGTGDDCVNSIALDSSGDMYVTGSTNSTNMPVSQNAFQASYAGYLDENLPSTVEQNLGDAFVAKLNPAGSSLLYFTYLGGNANDAGLAIAVDSSGDAYVAGFTDSTNFPLSASPYQSKMAGDDGKHYSVNVQGDGFLTVLNPSGTEALYSTYLGGKYNDGIGGLVLDGSGNVYLAGGSASPNMPVTSNAYQSTSGGSGDAYYAIFSGLSFTPPTITKVANAEGESATIAPNTWVEIKGSGLATDTRIWQGSDFVNNQLPTALDGSSVTFNGEKAFVYYISPSQINVLTPPDLASGSPTVQVTVNSVASGPITTTVQTYSPSFFVVNGGPYIVATHLNGSLCSAPISGVCLVGPSTLYPGYSTPAQPGETIVIYANGFGPTTPPVVSGSLTQSGTLVAASLQVRIDGVLVQPSPVTFAGLISPGLFQFNVVMPTNLSAGDHAISVTNEQGSVTQSGTLITVQ